MDYPLLYIKSRSISTESYYPYKAQSLSCDNYRVATASNYGPTYSIKKYSKLTPSGSCSTLETYILATGTVIVGVTVNTQFLNYQSGILTCTNFLSYPNHAVVVVGVASHYFRAQNSWGTNWGESGFIRLSKSSTANCNLCQHMYVSEAN